MGAFKYLVKVVCCMKPETLILNYGNLFHSYRFGVNTKFHELLIETTNCNYLVKDQDARSDFI